MYYLILTFDTIYDYEHHDIDYFLVFESKEKLDDFLLENKDKIKDTISRKIGKVEFGKAIFDDKVNAKELRNTSICDFGDIYNAHKGYWTPQ